MNKWKEELLRLKSVIFDPRNAFRDIISNGSTKRILLLMIVFSIVLGYATLSKSLAFIEYTLFNNPDLLKQPPAVMEQAKSMLHTTTTLGILLGPIVILPLTIALYSLVLTLNGKLLAWKGTFKNYYRIVAYSYIIVILQTIVLGLLQAVTPVENLIGVSTNLTLLFPDPVNAFWYRFLVFVDVFSLWNFFVIALGISVLEEEKPKKVVTIVYAIYFSIALIIAIAQQALGAKLPGTF